MDRYYYFISSLPVLNMEGKIPLSMDAFLDESRRLLTDKDCQIVERMIEGIAIEEGLVVLKEWQAFQNLLANMNVQLCATQSKKNPHDYIRGEYYENAIIQNLLSQIAKSNNLLENEKLIDKARWDFLDQIEVGHYFDLDKVIVYALKLKIMDRYAQMEAYKDEEFLKDNSGAEYSPVSG